MDLAADYPEITAKPPAYAEDTVESGNHRRPRGRDHPPERHGSLRLQVHPARRGRLPRLDADRKVKAEKIAAETTPHANPARPDRLTGSVTLPAVASGKYGLRLVAEHGIATDSRPMT